MPKPSQSNRKRIFYNLNIKRKKSGKKIKKIIEHAIMLLKREADEGMTPWIEHAQKMLHAKVEKHGISHAMINEVIQRKKLDLSFS